LDTLKNEVSNIFQDEKKFMLHALKKEDDSKSREELIKGLDRIKQVED
jgi:hypothetical protein